MFKRYRTISVVQCHDACHKHFISVEVTSGICWWRKTKIVEVYHEGITDLAIRNRQWRYYPSGHLLDFDKENRLIWHCHYAIENFYQERRREHIVEEWLA